MADPKALSPVQHAVHTLRQQGKTRPQIAAELGMKENAVSKTVTAINKKLGKTGPPGVALTKTTEYQDPEKFAKLFDAASEGRLKKIGEALTEAGIPRTSVDATLKRIRARYYGAITEVRNLKTEEILDMLGKKIHLALQYMDDKVMSEASFRDLALGTTAMIEKRALLRGEPTAIVSDAERKKLHELLPLAIAEAQRRGLTIPGVVTEKIIGPA